ncbi:DUF4386 domain-containing protein [Agrococcus sp. DT81.2]|uniref:DUF4386 domain-containing protein n=1 Tax=Agrococcus sp. DT81.2 TaxID=3393414 RepID=UPI003CE575E9
MTLALEAAASSTRAPRRSFVRFTSWSPRTASLVAGTGLAVMAVTSGVGNFAGIVPLVVRGDAAATATAIAASQPQFMLGIVGLAIAALLDFVVAAALYTLFRPTHPLLSAVAAWARAIYALPFLFAISQLVAALTVLDDPPAALQAIERFSTIWVTSLGLFGLHLVLTGVLAFRSGFMPRIFGVLLAIAGLGYLADAVGIWVVDGFSATFGQFLFAGEVVVIFWLLIRGRRLPAAQPAQS